MNGHQSGQPLRVLVADDDFNDRLFTREALLATDSPVAVIEVDGGLACLAALAAAAPPDLVLLDLNMPDLGGIEVLRRWPDEAPATLKVVLSSAADLATASNCYAAGCDLYLVKPAQFDEFEAMLVGLVQFAAGQAGATMPPTR